MREEIAVRKSREARETFTETRNNKAIFYWRKGGIPTLDSIGYRL